MEMHAILVMFLVISSGALRENKNSPHISKYKRMVIKNDQTFNSHTSQDRCPAANLYLERSLQCNSAMGQFKAERACHEDSLEIECDKPLVIVVHSAMFGWHGKGRSLRCNGKFPTSPEVCPVTCLTDQMKSLCTGRRRCDVDTLNETMQDLIKCGNPYKTFLEIIYTCMEKQVLKSLEQNKLGDPCEDEANKNKTKPDSNIKKSESKPSVSMTTLSSITTSILRNEDDDEDLQSSGNDVRVDLNVNIKDVFSSTKKHSIISTDDVENVMANIGGDDDDDYTNLDITDGGDDVDGVDVDELNSTIFSDNATTDYLDVIEETIQQESYDNDSSSKSQTYPMTQTNSNIDVTDDNHEDDVDDDDADQEGLYFNNDDDVKKSETSEDENPAEYTDNALFNDTNYEESYKKAFQVEMANLNKVDSKTLVSKQTVVPGVTNSNAITTADSNEFSEASSVIEVFDDTNASSDFIPLDFKFQNNVNFNDYKVNGRTFNNKGVDDNAGGGGSHFSFISEWHWILKHIKENTEKFVLYIALAICIGIIGALTSALIKATRCCVCEVDQSSPSSEHHHHHLRKGGDKSYRIDISSSKECSGRRSSRKKKKKKQDEVNSVSWRIPGSESSTGDDRTVDEDDEDDEETGDTVQLASYTHIDSLQRRSVSNSIPISNTDTNSYSYANSCRQQVANSDTKSNIPPPVDIVKANNPIGSRTVSTNDVSSLDKIQYAETKETVYSNNDSKPEIGSDSALKRRSLAGVDFIDSTNQDFQELQLTLLKNKQQQHQKMLENSQAVQNLQATLQKQKQQQMIQNQHKVLSHQQQNTQQQALQSHRNSLQHSQAKQHHSQLSLYSANSPSQSTGQSISKTSHTSSTAQTPLDVDSIHSSPVRRHQETSNNFHNSPVRSVSRNATPEPGVIGKTSNESEVSKNPPVSLPLPPPPTPSPYQTASTLASANSSINMPLPPPPLSATNLGSFPPFPPLPSPPPDGSESFFSNDCEESNRYVRSEFRRLDTSSAKVAPSPSYASINGPLTEQHLHQNHQREKLRNSNSSINHNLLTHPQSKILPNQKTPLLNGEVFQVCHQPLHLDSGKECNSIIGFSQQNQLPPPPNSHPQNKPPSKSQSDFNNFKSNSISKTVTNGDGGHYSQINNVCNSSKDCVKKENGPTTGGNLASSSMNGIFNSQYNYHAPSSSNNNATTAFNPSAVSDRSLEKSATPRQQQVVMQYSKSREGQKSNQVPFSSDLSGKPLVAKKLSVDAYFSTLPSSPLPTSSYSPPEPYRPDASAPINSYQYHHNHHRHHHNASPLHQRSQYNQHQNIASNVRKSSLTGSLGRAYSGHLVYLTDGDRTMLGGGSLANGRDIYLSQLATAASAAREQLHLGYGVVGGGMLTSDEEARRYRTLQPNFSHFYG